MISAELISILWLGFFIGLAHAFDADHIMAVSAMAQTQASRTSTLVYAVNWGLGHGLVLLAAGVLMFVFNIALPDWLVVLAEQAVGLLLIALGLVLVWHLYRNRLSLQAHKHDTHQGAFTHVHWLNKTQHVSADEMATTEKSVKKHKPIFVGMLHGLAGSAPVIALIPAMMQQNIVLSLAYMLLFSLACMLGMSLFGFGLQKSQQLMTAKLAYLNRLVRCSIGFMSIGLGTFWLMN